MNYINSECECGHQRFAHKLTWDFASIPEGDTREIPCICTGIAKTQGVAVKGIRTSQFRIPMCECNDFRETLASLAVRMRHKEKMKR